MLSLKSAQTTHRQRSLSFFFVFISSQKVFLKESKLRSTGKNDALLRRFMEGGFDYLKKIDEEMMKTKKEDR